MARLNITYTADCVTTIKLSFLQYNSQWVPTNHIDSIEDITWCWKFASFVVTKMLMLVWWDTFESDFICSVLLYIYSFFANQSYIFLIFSCLWKIISKLWVLEASPFNSICQQIVFFVWYDSGVIGCLSPGNCFYFLWSFYIILVSPAAKLKTLLSKLFESPSKNYIHNNFLERM